MMALFSGLSTTFFWLLDHTMEISVLICLIFLVRIITAKKMPAWWHYGLWVVLLVRMLIPLDFESRISLVNFMPEMPSGQVSGLIAGNPYENELFTYEMESREYPELTHWRFPIASVLPLLWFTGAMVFGLCILVESISFWAAIRKKVPVIDEKVLGLLAECKSRMKIRAAVDVVITDKVRSPALYGYFRPRLLLPEGVLVRLNQAELSYAFMHELGHLKRHDICVSWLAAVLQVLYWFNPLVWAAFFQLRIDQEAACDASVLSRIKQGRSEEYAKAIIGFLEKFYQNGQLPSLASILENKVQVKKRLTRIVRYKESSRKTTAAAIALLLSTGVAFYALSGSARDKQPEPANEKKEVAYTQALEALDIAALREDAGIVSAGAGSGENSAGTPEEMRGPQDLAGPGGSDALKTDEPTTPVGMASHVPDTFNEEASAERKPFLLTASEPQVTLPDPQPVAQVAPPRQSDTSASPAPGMETAASPHDSMKGEGPQVPAAQVAGPPASSLTANAQDSSNGLNEESVEGGRKGDASPDAPGYGAFESRVVNTIQLAGGADDTSPATQFLPSEVDSPPKVIRSSVPRYPYLAQRDNISGFIRLRFVVTKDGDAKNAVIVESKPKGIFDKSALEALALYRFEPGIRDGKSVDVTVQLPIKFYLADGRI